MAKNKTSDNYTPHGGEHLMTTSGSEGYEKLGDKIWPAPATTIPMDEISERQMGFDAYIQAMNRYIVEQFRVLAADRQRWWDWAIKAYGLDPTKNYQWNPSDHSIELMPDTKEPA